MTCRECSVAIAELDDSSLDLARERALEEHLAGCAACRALLADVKSIRAAAFTLPRTELPGHILDALRSRIADEPRPTRGRLLAWPGSRGATAAWLAAAAALLVVTTAGMLSLLRPASDVPATAATAAPTLSAGGNGAEESVLVELRAATEHYERAIQQLEQLAQSGNGTLDPQVAAVVQKNLQVIDLAIGESRAALTTQPASAGVQDGLFEAMRSKVALLQQAVELISEMSKGNQAETGRLLQGLNQ